MPRVENLGSEVDRYCSATGNGSSTFDVCVWCRAKLANNPHAFDGILAPYNAREPDGDKGRGGQVEHPPYADEDPPYQCAVCDKKLTAKDD